MYNYHSSSSRPPADLMDGTFEEAQPLHITAHHDQSQHMETELEKHIMCPCAQCQKRPLTSNTPSVANGVGHIALNVPIVCVMSLGTNIHVQNI